MLRIKNVFGDLQQTYICRETWLFSQKASAFSRKFNNAISKDTIEFNRNLRVLNAPAIFEYITVLAYPSRFRGECRGPRCMSFQTSVLGNL